MNTAVLATKRINKCLPKDWRPYTVDEARVRYAEAFTALEQLIEETQANAPYPVFRQLNLPNGYGKSHRFQKKSEE